MKIPLIPKRRESTLMRMDPVEDLFDRLHREINELFDAYYHGFNYLSRRGMVDTGLEVSETDDEIRVKAELPGMKEKDIEVLLDDNILTIRGKYEKHKEKKNRNYYISEMSRGNFQRSIPLQAEIDRDKVKAKFKRGQLTLILPKTGRDRTQSRRIPISTD